MLIILQGVLWLRAHVRVIVGSLTVSIAASASDFMAMALAVLLSFQSNIKKVFRGKRILKEVLRRLLCAPKLTGQATTCTGHLCFSAEKHMSAFDAS